MFNSLFKTTRLVVHTTASILVIASLLLAPFPSQTVLAQATTTSVSDEIGIEIIPDTLIETGTAVGVSDTYTIENINDFATTPTSSNESALSATSSTTTEEFLLLDSNGTSTPTTITDASASSATQPTVATTSTSSIETINHAVASTSATTTANAGTNTASGPGNTAIVTGDAYAYSNIVNLTNTNIIDSIGFIVFLNQLFGTQGVDIRDLFAGFSSDSGEATSNPCTAAGCEANSLNYYSNNQATIENDVFVAATTGGNQASGTTAAIITGDAYAAANVTNITNTNIVDSNYMLFTFSNFGDLLGDVVLPGKNLLEKLFRTSSSGIVPTAVNIDNQSSTENTVITNANTGDNTGANQIATGNATTYNNIYNQSNTNVINNDSFTMLFRVAGDWNGQVYGLPDGLTWELTSQGIAITSLPSLNTAVSTPAIQSNITNNATIKNTVSVSATTGDNYTNGAGEDYIQTGNAYAASNITNIANTNILGRNWSLLIFDIFGNWNGNISFGKPDLWIGGSANTADQSTTADQEVTYTFTVSNLGDATAHNVTLNGAFSNDLMTLVDPLQNIQLGSLAPGETIEKTVTARVTNNLSRGTYAIDLTAEVSAIEPDENTANNTEVVTITAENLRRGGSGGGGSGILKNKTADADLVIKKSVIDDTILAGETASYEVSITNIGGPVYGANLFDTLYGPEGEIIASKNWALGTIDTDETIVVTYDTVYAADTPDGRYLNRAQVLGFHKNSVQKHMHPYDSNIATVSVRIGEPEPQVLGLTSLANSCTPYLTAFLKAGQPNDRLQVNRLQAFLNSYMTQSLPINGAFDAETAQAVQTFQQRYAADILEPWGLDTPTGYVYYTTQKKINELYCNDTEAFPLSDQQLAEMSQFKFAKNTETHTLALEQTTTPLSIPLAPSTSTLTTPLNKEEISQGDTPHIALAWTAPDTQPEPQSDNLFTKLFQWVTKPNLQALAFWK